MARKTTESLSLRRCRIGVIGLGYVGLPLAVEFGRHYETVGFDVHPERIAELSRGSLEGGTRGLDPSRRGAGQPPWIAGPARRWPDAGRAPARRRC